MKRLLNIVAVVLFTLGGYLIGFSIAGFIMYQLKSTNGLILARDIWGLKLMPFVVAVAAGYISFTIIFKR